MESCMQVIARIKWIDIGLHISPPGYARPSARSCISHLYSVHDTLFRRLDVLSLGELTRSARNSSQVRQPTARSGARLAPARNARAALPGSQTGMIGRCR